MMIFFTVLLATYFMLITLEQGAKYEGMRSGCIPPSILHGIMHDPEFLRIPTFFSSVLRYLKFSWLYVVLVSESLSCHKYSH
jgi:hypothetical protein